MKRTDKTMLFLLSSNFQSELQEHGIEEEKAMDLTNIFYDLVKNNKKVFYYWKDLMPCANYEEDLIEYLLYYFEHILGMKVTLIEEKKKSDKETDEEYLARESKKRYRITYNLNNLYDVLWRK